MKFWRDGDPIIQVEIDTHRWYSIITVSYESGENFATVIGGPMGDGLANYSSYEEWAGCAT